MSAALALMLLSHRATAAEPAIPIRIEYSAPASCPDGKGLFAHVQARTARARAADPNETARELSVRVDETNGRFRGRLLVAASSEGAPQAREVTDASCDELIEALGFFIALSIDPHATAAPSTTTPTPTAVAATDSDRAGVQGRPSSSTVLSPFLPPSPVSTSSVAASTSVEPDRSRSRIERKGPWHFGVGAGATLVSGLAPKVLLGSRVVVDVSHERISDSVFTPFVSLGAISTATGVDSTALGGIALRWQALIGTMCPLELPLFTLAVFRPCSLLEAGRLRGEGIDIRNARRTEAEWFAVGLSGRLELMVWSALFLELEVGGSAPVSRPGFRYSSGVTAFDTAALGARTSLTLALRL